MTHRHPLEQVSSQTIVVTVVNYSFLGRKPGTIMYQRSFDVYQCQPAWEKLPSNLIKGAKKDDDQVISVKTGESGEIIVRLLSETLGQTRITPFNWEEIIPPLVTSCDQPVSRTKQGILSPQEIVVAMVDNRNSVPPTGI